MSGGIPNPLGGMSMGDNRAGKGPPPPQMTPEEKARFLADQQRKVTEREEARTAAALLPPDVADIAMRDATTGKVRRVRGGSTRQSILGQAMEFAVIVGIVGLAWVRAVLRGDVW